MAKQQRQHNPLVCDNSGNESYISEQCFRCEKEFISIKDIFVGTEDDRYYCRDCADTYEIEVVKCRDYDYLDLDYSKDLI
jgi:hypothetical protein